MALPTPRWPAALLLLGLHVALTGCTTRSVDVLPLATDPAEFTAWGCERLAEERDAVQQRAAELAYTLDERVGNNVVALGVGVMIFWPAVLAMRPDGLEAAELARLKGRFEALQASAQGQGCAAAADGSLSPAQLAALPLAVGEQLVYEQRSGPRTARFETRLRVVALRRGEIEYAGVEPTVGQWQQDRMGNVTSAPPGTLRCPRLLRGELQLGAVTAGDIVVSGDPVARARMRGQVVAVGPQTVAGRRFDAAVIELFGDAPRAEGTTGVEGVIVVDRRSGVLLRLELRSADAAFALQRRLVRVDAAG